MASSSSTTAAAVRTSIAHNALLTATTIAAAENATAAAGRLPPTTLTPFEQLKQEAKATGKHFMELMKHKIKDVYGIKIVGFCEEAGIGSFATYISCKKWLRSDIPMTPSVVALYNRLCTDPQFVTDLIKKHTQNPPTAIQRKRQAAGEKVSTTQKAQPLQLPPQPPQVQSLPSNDDSMIIDSEPVPSPRSLTMSPCHSPIHSPLDDHYEPDVVINNLSQTSTEDDEEEEEDEEDEELEQHQPEEKDNTDQHINIEVDECKDIALPSHVQTLLQVAVMRRSDVFVVPDESITLFTIYLNQNIYNTSELPMFKDKLLRVNVSFHSTKCYTKGTHHDTVLIQPNSKAYIGFNIHKTIYNLAAEARNNYSNFKGMFEIEMKIIIEPLVQFIEAPFGHPIFYNMSYFVLINDE